MEIVQISLDKVIHPNVYQIKQVLLNFKLQITLEFQYLVKYLILRKSLISTFFFVRRILL